MRGIAKLAAAFVFLGALAFGQSTSNNTSACSANGVPVWCNGVGQMPFLNPSDAGAQTTTLDPLPTAVSTLSVHNYLYSGATTRVGAVHLPYFCNTASPCNGHKVIGMQESNAAGMLIQAQYMKSVGIDVVIEDFYGCGVACGEESGQAYNLSISIALANAIAANPSTTPKLAIMLDAGAVNSSGGGTGQCPPASGDQSACLITAYNKQMDYVAKTWLYQSYYEVNANDGHPIVLYFPNKGDWPGTNFNTVFAAVAAHATAGQSCGSGCTYATTVDFLDENAGGFSESGIAGGYAWPQPNTYSSSNQLCYLGNPCSFNYVADFYSHARANSSKIAMGLFGKGFDDHNAPWGSNRVTAQQCGQLPSLYGSQITTAGYGFFSQLQYAIWATWDDYEEGTEVETGIDNCFTVGAPTISAGTLSWSLIKSDATYASTSTINNLAIYTGTSAPTSLFASGIAPTATSHAAPPPSAGQNVWVYMNGQPLIMNRLSAPVSNNGGPAATPTAAPGAGTYSGTQSVALSTTSPGAVLCYTTNGTMPATNGTTGCTVGTLYSAPISVSTSETVNAIAGGTGYTDSTVGSFAYVINTTAAAPTFAPVAGTYSGTQSVTISTASSGAIQCYTTNGSTPATNGTTGCTTGTLYSTPVSVSSSETLKAIAGGTGYTDSSVSSAAYIINPTASAPTFSPVAGTYTSIQSLTLSTSSGGAIICYTTNGLPPVTNGAAGCAKGSLYLGPFNVSTSETVNAVAGGTGYGDSTVSSAAYVINLPAFIWGSGSGSGSFTISFGNPTPPLLCGPPAYACSSTSTANAGVITPIFVSTAPTSTTCSGQCVNSIAYDTTINPYGIDPYVRITDGTTSSVAPGQSFSSTSSGGDNDRMWSLDTGTDAYVIAGATGGFEYVFHLDTSANAVRLINTGHPGIVVTGMIAFSQQIKTRFYLLKGATGISYISQIWQYDITSDSTATSSMLVDVAAAGVCPGLPASFNATWSSVLNGSATDDKFTFSLSNAGGQNTGIWTVSWSKTLGCSTVNMQTGSWWAYCTGGSCGPSTPAGGTLNTSGGCWGAAPSSPQGIHDTLGSTDGNYAYMTIAGTGWTQGACAGMGAIGYSVWQTGTGSSQWCNINCPDHTSLGYSHAVSNYYAGPNIRANSNVSTDTQFAPAYSPLLEDWHSAWPAGTADTNPMLLGTDDLNTGNGSGCANAIYCPIYQHNEIMAISPVATYPPGGPFIRFGHPFSCGRVATGKANCTAGADNYFQGQFSIMSCSPSGKYCALSSTMLGSLGTDVFGKPRQDIFVITLQ